MATVCLLKLSSSFIKESCLFIVAMINVIFIFFQTVRHVLNMLSARASHEFSNASDCNTS